MPSFLAEPKGDNTRRHNTMNSEDMVRAGYKMKEAASDMLRAADLLSESARKLELLFGQGYGSNIDKLIEALERNATPIEQTSKNNKCDCVDCGAMDHVTGCPAKG